MFYCITIAGEDTARLSKEDALAKIPSRFSLSDFPREFAQTYWPDYFYFSELNSATQINA